MSFAAGFRNHYLLEKEKEGIKPSFSFWSG